MVEKLRERLLIVPFDFFRTVVVLKLFLSTIKLLYIMPSFLYRLLLEIVWFNNNSNIISGVQRVLDARD